MWRRREGCLIDSTHLPWILGNFVRSVRRCTVALLADIAGLFLDGAHEVVITASSCNGAREPAGQLVANQLVGHSSWRMFAWGRGAIKGGWRVLGLW